MFGVVLVSIYEHSCRATVAPQIMQHAFVLAVHSLVALGEGDIFQMSKSARAKLSSRCFCDGAGVFKIQHRLIQTPQSVHSHCRQHCSSSMRDMTHPRYNNGLLSH